MPHGFTLNRFVIINIHNTNVDGAVHVFFSVKHHFFCYLYVFFSIHTVFPKVQLTPSRIAFAAPGRPQMQLCVFNSVSAGKERV